MSRAQHSAAMTESVDASARKHLLRADGQEDLCFGIWRPSTGQSRKTALIQKLILPKAAERTVHGNVSFEPAYFERALAEAASEGAGLALLHSHPMGRKWQGMSLDDIRAEEGHAAAAFGATQQPFLGLTVAGDGSWSARFWERIAPRQYRRFDCATVRVVGDALKVTYQDRLAPPPPATEMQVRTISAWGPEKQTDLVRLRVGVIGAGSVGAFIAEGLARTGFEDISLIDFDTIEQKNLDRLLYATRKDIGTVKVRALASRLQDSATAENFRAEVLECAVYEEEGFRAALDCDVLLSCVDRPWGRHVLNMIAYAHLIPVIDGGIAIRQNRSGELSSADWRAHSVGPEHRCMECLGQYDSAYVQAEREGRLDDPTYIQNLRKDHPLRMSENVFAFSMACASLQMLQLLNMTLSPLAQANSGEQLYHFVGSFMEPNETGKCSPECLFPTMIASGDHCSFVVTGERRAAGNSLSHRRNFWRRVFDTLSFSEIVARLSQR